MRLPKHAALAVLLALSLLASQSPAHAQVANDDGDTAAGPVRFLKYVSCVALVYAATSMPLLVIAVGTCLRTVLDEVGPNG